jgi:hypothetical protein
MEQSGYYLWEGMMFAMEIFAGVGLLVLRRKASGRPAFTDDDRQFFFGHARVNMSMPKFWINFGIAAFLCICAGGLERLILAPLGASTLATTQLITFTGIVKKSLC